MYSKKDKDLICQGDLFKNFNYIRWAEEVDGELKIDEIVIPYLFILTQACDLFQDSKDRTKDSKDIRDKYLQSVLVCPAYIADSFKKGEHLKDGGFIMASYSSIQWSNIRSNQNHRLHFIPSHLGLGIPNLVVDFKNYYTIPTAVIYKFYKQHYVASLNPLFKENLSHRFAFYLSRIGLPGPKEAESKISSNNTDIVD